MSNTKMPNDPQFVIVDCETTGLDPANAELIELALCCGAYRYEQLYGSLRPIPPETSGIHHITDADVARLPQFDLPALLGHAAGRIDWDRAVFVAHNAKFDQAFIDPTGQFPWLCTYRLALHLVPDAPSHSNQALRYYLGVEPEGIPDNLHPHRALYDAITTEAVFEWLLRQYDLEGYKRESLITFAERPAVLGGAIRFGKHRGTDWYNVPRDYLRWITRQQDMDADVRQTAAYHLEASHG